PELRGQIFIGDFIYPRYRLLILAVAVAAVTATWFIVYRTAFGRVVRAGVQNPDVVGALGLSLAPYMPAIAALGVGLAGLAGVPLRSSIDVVVFAVACMGLNILVGTTGLVSFGHGAWFGLGAYAAALSQQYWFPGSVILPTLFAILFVAVTALLSGALILRRRGVYFSLLTL